MTWPVYDAKARFSQFLETALKDGPQVVTRRGVETAVLVPFDEWKRLKAEKETAQAPFIDPPFIDPLTDPNGPHDLYIPPRRMFRRRPPPMFED
ncbi:MAG: type II toxin-antitoxin system Phd/YefM family antitoxin [Terracidiphilus sp.]